MIESLYKITGRLVVEPQVLDSIAANMANANSPGFKGQHLTINSFSDLLDTSISRFTPTGYTVHRGELVQDMSSGSYKHTDRALDFAIQGDAMFVVKSNNGADVFTRNGDFRVTDKGVLVTQDGLEVVGKNGQIRFDAAQDDMTSIRVKPNGIVTVQGTAGPREVAQLKLIEVTDHKALMRTTPSFFVLKKGMGDSMREANNPNVTNFTLEMANVSPITEMTKMIESVRSFETAHRVLGKLDELFKKHQAIVQ
ncbi:hypothetical protein BVX99_02625 [bacterium F16]|nr:hypothetical protein BVX99_02625 [bacterium F16]